MYLKKIILVFLVIFFLQTKNDIYAFIKLPSYYSMATDTVFNEFQLNPDTILTKPSKNILNPPIKPSFSISSLIKDRNSRFVRYGNFMRYDEIVSDAALRWEFNLDMADHLNRYNHILSYRQGTEDRFNAFLIGIHEPKYQKLFMNHIPLNDPLTQQVNWNALPIQKISYLWQQHSASYANVYTSLQEHYIAKPRTILNYQEHSNKIQNIDFHLARNFTKKFNIEISYGNKQETNDYARSQTTKNTVFFKSYLLRGHRSKWDVSLLWNQWKRFESDGYTVLDNITYQFSPFISSPIRPNAKSTTNVIYAHTSYTHFLSPQNELLQMQLWLHKNDRVFLVDQDTVDVNTQTIGIQGRYNVIYKGIRLEQSARFSQVNFMDNEMLTKTRFTYFNFSQKSLFNLFPSVFFNNSIGIEKRSDMSIASQFDISFKWKLGDFQINGSLGHYYHIPDIQALYWSTASFQGNDELRLMRIESGHLTLIWKPYTWLQFRLNGGIKNIFNAYELTSDNISSFQPINDFQNYRIDASMNLKTKRWYIFATYGILNWQNLDSNSALSHPFTQAKYQYYAKGGLYYENYFFRRATYVKMGLETQARLSPSPAYTFNAYLYRWHPDLTNQLLPIYMRIDANLSARIRWFIITLRYENILDNIGIQRDNYAEAIGYPMPDRRLLFGVKIIFSN